MLKFLYVLSMLLSLLTTVLTEGILSRRTSPVEGKVNRIEENAIIFLIDRVNQFKETSLQLFRENPIFPLTNWEKLTKR